MTYGAKVKSKDFGLYVMDVKTALVRGQGDDIVSGKWAFVVQR